MFKVKQTKKILKMDNKSLTTLDNKHNEFIQEFQHNEKITIPKLNEEKINYFNLLKKTKNIDEKLDIQDKINETKEKIKKLKDKKKKYYLKNSKYIFEYFENKKNINEKIKNNLSKNNLIGEFFKIKNNDNDILQNNDKNKNIVQNYLSNIDDSFINLNLYINNTDYCMVCGVGELIIVEDDGVLLCNHCFKNIPYLVENEKPSYKEPPKEVCFNAYKRLNHWKEILSQFQGKETTQISNDIIEKIKQQMKKERININENELTDIKIKEILKKLNLNKYYEHIAFIKNKLGIKPLTMAIELEETLCNLFIELQSPYAKHVPGYRVNFLNYYYVLYKLCELLGETQYLKHIPMLKDRYKLIEQDMIWFGMCKTLNWEYIPTI
jgi:hypothetical protein